MCAWTFVENYDGLLRESGTNLLAFRFCVRKNQISQVKTDFFFLCKSAKTSRGRSYPETAGASQIFLRPRILNLYDKRGGILYNLFYVYKELRLYCYLFG